MSLTTHPSHGPVQSTVFDVKRQNHSGSTNTTGKYFVTATCGITGYTVYLQHDGTLRGSCCDGWFKTIGEVGSAICKFHTR